MVRAVRVCQCWEIQVIGSEAEEGPALVDDERGKIGEDAHSCKLGEGPFPGFGFALHHGGGGEALEGVDVEDEDREDDERWVGGRAVGFLGGLDGAADLVAEGLFVVFIFLDREGDGDLGDEDLAGGEGGEGGGAEAGVPAEGFDERLEEVADAAHGGVVELALAFGGFGVGAEGPEDDDDAEDEGAGLLQEGEAAVDDMSEHVAEVGEAVGGEFEKEMGGGFADADALAEQPCDKEGGAGAEEVNEEHHRGLPEDAGDEEGNEDRVNRETGGAGLPGEDENGEEALLVAADGAGGHDAGDGAGVSGEEGQEGLSGEADAGHDPVHEEGGARHVAGAL